MLHAKRRAGSAVVQRTETSNHLCWVDDVACRRIACHIDGEFCLYSNGYSWSILCVFVGQVHVPCQRELMHLDRHLRNCRSLRYNLTSQKSKKNQGVIFTNERVDKLRPVDRFVVSSIFYCRRNSFLLGWGRLGLHDARESDARHKR